MSGVVMAIALGLGLLWANPSTACVCADRDGCGSAASCVGKNPGDVCGKQRTCKIRVGTGEELGCCCGCSRGDGPIGCNYQSLTPFAGGLSEIGCDNTAVAKLADKVADQATQKLGQASDACEAGKNAEKKAAGATAAVNRLDRKLERLAQRGKITAECAAAGRALIADFVTGIGEVEAGGHHKGGGPTSTTTTTTVPSGGLSCSGALSVYDPNEFDFVFSCLPPGGPFEGFGVQVPGGRQVTNWLQPSGFSCSPTTWQMMNDTLWCTGPFSTGSDIGGGRIHTVPPPTAGMGSSLWVRAGGVDSGPFSLTGP